MKLCIGKYINFIAFREIPHVSKLHMFVLSTQLDRGTLMTVITRELQQNNARYSVYPVAARLHRFSPTGAAQYANECS